MSKLAGISERSTESEAVDCLDNQNGSVPASKQDSPEGVNGSVDERSMIPRIFRCARTLTKPLTAELFQLTP